MNILFITSDHILEKEVQQAFTAAGGSVRHLTAPSRSMDSAGYLQQLLAKVKECSPDFIFSLNFYPFISYACGVLKLPFVCWLCDGTQMSYYDSAIRNEWNYVFAADSFLYRDLQQHALPNLYYLPLGGTPVAPITDIDAAYQAGISMIGTIRSREEMDDFPLSPSSNLKDATKGYLEGCIACQYQLHSLFSLSEKLPAYVMDDLQKYYPLPQEGSMAAPWQYYDYVFFNDLITYADRELHLSSLAADTRFSPVHLYSSTSTDSLDSITLRGYADYEQTLPLIAQSSVLNLHITHRNYRNGISPAAWRILSCGGFLLSNFQADYSILSVSPVLYSDAYEMHSKAAYYFHHEAERRALSQAIYEEICDRHTYVHRIEELFSFLSFV